MMRRVGMANWRARATGLLHTLRYSSTTSVGDTSNDAENIVAGSSSGSAPAENFPPAANVPDEKDVSPNIATSMESGGQAVDHRDQEEPERWLQKPYVDPDVLPIVDEKGSYIVSNRQWPTGEVAYRTPEAPGHLAPRFGYNVLQVKKDVSWWQHYHKYPRFSLAYLNIQLFFLLGVAWLTAFLMTEYRNITDEMRTPGAMVGEHRGRGPSAKGTQKISFTPEEMDALIGGAQNNWLDAKGELNYVGSNNYRMKQISRPKEFSTDDFRKR